MIEDKITVRQGTTKGRNTLSTRQRKALEMYMEGAATEDIAAIIGVARHTITAWRKTDPWIEEQTNLNEALYLFQLGGTKKALLTLLRGMDSDNQKIANFAAKVWMDAFNRNLQSDSAKAALTAVLTQVAWGAPGSAGPLPPAENLS